VLPRETLTCVDFRNHIWLYGSQIVMYKEVYGDCGADEWKFSAEFFFMYLTL